MQNHLDLSQPVYICNIVSISFNPRFGMLHHIHQPLCVKMGLGVAHLQQLLYSGNGKIERGV